MNHHKISLFLVSFLLMAFAIPSHGQSFSVEATADPPSVCQGESSILTAIPVNTNQPQSPIPTNHRNSGERPVVTITFASPVSENDFSIEKADLKYDKDFAYSIQVDDGESAVYEKAYPLLEGGTYQGEDLPGLYYTDGCGNDVSFKMATAHYSWHTNFNVDMHNPSGDFVNTITWEEMIELYQNNWGIYNHGFGHDGASGDDYYDVVRNHSFTKRNTYPEIGGGIHMNLFVIPAASTFLGPIALNNGYNQVISLNYTTGAPYYNVNEDQYFNVEISRHFGISEIESAVDQLAEAASNGEKVMTTTGLHDFNFQEFRNQLENIEDTYGKSGTDQLWFATSEEVIQYLYVRDNLELSTNTDGNTVTITLNGDLPSDFRFYALSLLVDTEADITDIQVENGFNNTTNANFNGQALINLNWDERVIIPREELAEEYVTIAEETQETNDALIGMDYTEMVEDTSMRNFYRSRLCAIPGVDLPDGYCSGITDYTYEWSLEGEVIGNEPSLEVTPGSTSTYEVEVSNGEETASDTVIVELTEPPYIEAQPDDEVCSDQPYELSVEEAGNYSQVQWETSGDGYFSDNTIEEPTYFPGAQDLEGGNVSLTVTAISEGCENVTDTVIIDFMLGEITIYAGEDDTMCVDEESYQLSGEVSGTDNFTWITQGDGTFSDTTILDPLYYPGENEQEEGYAYPGLKTTGNNTCTNTITDFMLLEIHEPSINAGPDTTLCNGTSVQLDAQVEDCDSLIWITQGDGSFENPHNAETTYYPGPEDEEEMQVLLYAEAINTVACDTTVADSLMITFEEAAQVETDSLQAACASDSVIEISGTAEYYSEAQWSTEGSGQFSDASSLNTNYLPSQEDINSGEISLILSVSSTGGCQSEDADTLILDFVPVPFASAGDNISTCEGNSVTLSGEVANSSDFYWQTSGDGIFEDSSNLNTIYTPGENDIETGNAIIQLIAEPLSPCNDNAVDNLTITIDPAVTVNIIPEEDTIYAGDDYELTAYAENNSALEWEVIGGEGDIEPVNQSTTTYYSVEQDTLNSPVTLEVTAYPAGTCESNATDQLLLYVIPPPEINAGEDIETCVTTEEVMVNGSSELDTSFTWSTSGEGEFENPNELQTSYFPDENDISNDSVTLTLSADSNPEILNDSLKVFFNDLPTCELEEDTAGICGDDSLFLAPGISNATTVEWNTSGDGTFSDTTSVETTYFPGSNDIDNGSVTLYATAYSDYCPDTTATDSIIVNIEPAPIAYAGADSTVCSNINMMLLSDAEAFEYDSVNWASSGTGSFNDETLVNAQYYPSTEDKNNGQVALTLTALGQGYCSGEDDDSRTIFFSESPSVVIPENYSACENSFVEIEAMASDAASIEWYTEGDGTFTDSLGVTAVYQAGNEDITNGEAMLYAVASGMAECSNVTDTAFTLLEVFSEPTVNAGNDTYTCNDSHLLNGEATDYSEIQWSTSGTGDFDNPNLLETFYYPSEQDFEEGQVTLTLSADPISPCTEETSDTLVLTLQSTPPPPSQPQGEQTVCYEVNAQTQTQYSTDPVEEANQYIWTISPPARGEFAQPTTTEPQNTVTWGEATGSFTINVKAENNCGTSEYSEGLDGNYLQADVEIEAIPDSIACFGQNIELNATSPDDSLYIWYPGGFTGPNIFVENSMFDSNEETYEVEFTDINGCSATDNIQVMFTTCTSKPSAQQEKQPVIAPNPARKYIKVKYHEKARIELLNSNGQNLKTFHHHFSNNPEKKISLDNLPTGIYVIKLQNTKTTYILKFVHIQ